MNFSFILELLALWCTCTSWGEAALSYSCDQTGEISIENPYAATHVSVLAWNPDQNCDAVFQNGRAQIVISNCDMDKRVEVMLSKETLLEIPADGIIRHPVVIHTVLCKQIPAEGANQTLIDESLVTNVIQSTVQSTAVPEVGISSDLLDQYSREEKTVAMIGEPIRWEIRGPEGYIVLPLTCTAYAGPIVSPSTDNVLLVVNGCSVELNLATHFQYESETEKHIAWTTVYAFRWTTSTEVTIDCNIQACPNTSNACDIFCGFGKRSIAETRLARYTDTDSDPWQAEEPKRGHTKVHFRVIGTNGPQLLLPYQKNDAITLMSNHVGSLMLVAALLLARLDPF